MKHLILSLVVAMSTITMSARTLVAYYSYTNNIEHVVNELKTQTE